MSLIELPRLQFYCYPIENEMTRDILQGLSQRQKTISSKYLYDQRGSRLFSHICKLDEYYPTRAETEILQIHRQSISETLGRQCHLIELGSGTCQKTRLLVDSLESPEGYTAVDIEERCLQDSLQSMAALFPHLNIIGVCADFTKLNQLPNWRTQNITRRILFIAGSTLGNLTPGEAVSFLNRSQKLLQPGDGVLVGIDLKKSEHIINAAYNDSKGITAQFNKNILDRMNREMGAEFKPNLFRHHAFYDSNMGRVEMHLRSTQQQTVNVAGLPVHFEEGESIHTENSYKYSVAEFQDILHAAGMRPIKYWIDRNRLFSIHFATVPGVLQ